MSHNRLPKPFRNGVHTRNEEPFTERVSSTNPDIFAIPEGVSDNAVELVRRYPGQSIALGFLVGAAVAILLRKLR